MSITDEAVELLDFLCLRYNYPIRNNASRFVVKYIHFHDIVF